jgi:hypothetical protein
MALSYTISAQEYRLLDLIASKEENPRAPDVYMSLYPSTFDSRIPQMTLADIDNFQTSRIRTTGASACGRYQFIRSTLRELVNNARLPNNLVFNRVMQDYLALILLQGAQLRSWQAGTLSWSGRGYTTNDPDAAFQVYLARVWAAIPVPGAMRGSERNVVRGESYYAGDGLNSSGINADVMYRELRSLRLQGPRETFTLDLESSSRSHPITGDTAWSQAQIAAGGGQTYYGGSSREGRNTYTGSPVADSLPVVDNPYEYDQIHLLDNRYDFRTGKKVRDLLYNGVQPAAANAFADNNGRPPGVDIGDDPEGVQEVAGNTRPDGTGTDLVEITLPNGNRQSVPASSAAAIASQRRN